MTKKELNNMLEYYNVGDFSIINCFEKFNIKIYFDGMRWWMFFRKKRIKKFIKYFELQKPIYIYPEIFYRYGNKEKLTKKERGM
jgi:hypothetical protein